jgi:hypothetical protein
MKTGKKIVSWIVVMVIALQMGCVLALANEVVEDTVFIATFSKITQEEQPEGHHEISVDAHLQVQAEALDSMDINDAIVTEEFIHAEEIEKTVEIMDEAEAPDTVEEVESLEDMEEPTQDIIEKSNDAVEVLGSVVVDWMMPEGKPVCEGDTLRLKATPFGLDDVGYDICWQYDSGQGWTDVPGDELMLELIVEEGFCNLEYQWRIVLTPI